MTTRESGDLLTRKERKQPPSAAQTLSRGTVEKRLAEQNHRKDERLAHLEAKIRWLEVAVSAPPDSAVLGRCAHCSEGVLLRTSDTLHCTSCGYARHL